MTSPDVRRFRYVNWRGEEHEYVVDFAAGHNPGRHTHEGEECISGQVITRDGDRRPEMGPTRRRTFVVAQMRDVEDA